MDKRRKDGNIISKISLNNKGRRKNSSVNNNEHESKKKSLNKNSRIAFDNNGPKTKKKTKTRFSLANKNTLIKSNIRSENKSFKSSNNKSSNNKRNSGTDFAVKNNKGMNKKRKSKLQITASSHFKKEDLVAIQPILSPQLIAMRNSKEKKSKNRFENRYYRLSNRQLSPEIQSQLPSSPADAVKMIPLGGLCEIGKNMTAYEYGNDIIIVDVGVAFAGEDQPGVDAIIPGMQYIFKNKNKLRGVFITHGHEDHIGAIRWLLKEVKCDVYGGPLTISLIKGKLEEAGLQSRFSDLHIIKNGQVQRAGKFDVEFIHVNHSIADSSALAIYTPAGLIIHSGDFKIDYTPTHGRPIDLPRFAELGDAGVLLFVCESTNISKPGFSMSESKVAEEFSKQFDRAKGRIIVATFSSNVHRVQQILSAAEDHGRKVVLLGRSMLSVFQAAYDLGYIDVNKDTLIEEKDMDKYPDDKVCIIMTGSQGEPLAALSRIAYAEHRTIDIKHGDRIILSANTIPGNEKPIFRMIDELYKRGAEVIYSQLADVHVSGHAYQEEIKLLHELVRPKYFVPVHGEYRMLHQHSELSHSLGMPYERIFLLNNGDVCAFSDNFAGVVGYENANPVFIDGLHPQTSDTSVLYERKCLSEDGVLVLSLSVNNRGEILAEPAIYSYGYLFESDREAFPKKLTILIDNFIKRCLAENRNVRDSLASPVLKNEINRFCLNEFGRSPVIVIHVLEVDKY